MVPSEIIDPMPTSSDELEVLTNVTSEDVTAYLNQISPYFKVDKTKYGGRGCFSYSEIPAGTVLLTCEQSLSSTIVKPFRKEACTFCFSYYDGRILKSKIQKKFGKDVVSLFFCSEKCKEQFCNQDIDDIYQDSLLEVEKHYINGLNKHEEELKEPPKNMDLDEVIKQEWVNVSLWEKKVSSTKASKRANMIPRISDSEYIEIKYVIGVLFKLFSNEKNQTTLSINQYLHELPRCERDLFELNLFRILQSTELEKVHKYPYLLYSYINIYKFIKLTALPPLQPFITSDLVRSSIGRNISNAFGIWSDSSSSEEEREYFGFGVYPSASYFNHSCGPNVVKKRIENKLTFTTLRDISAGEELCIDYGNYINEPVEVRQKELSEWFFNCGCDKCVAELQQLSS
ncbi:hypothetical protein G9P44_002907 [Scheffersomyces stipitis]|nr:hypothetical protein G9P44_002907 [Scheffersomyces stipitis]